jgi:hypothetical protein
MENAQTSGAAASAGISSTFATRGRRALKRVYGFASDIIFGTGAHQLDSRDVESYLRTTDG